MELISTQRMSYESWLHTWNLEDDDDFSSSDDESNTKEGEERSATLKDLRRVQRRECSHEDEINGQCCAICLSRFTKKREETEDDDGNKQRAVQRCFRLAELPCKHVYHEECIESWLARSRRCPTCRKSLREKKKKTGTQAKNGSEERLLSRPNDDDDENDDDDDARAQSRRELERESIRRLREMETRARERRAREVEEERRARRRNRMETVLEHEGMNEEIFESVMTHAMGLLEAAAVAGEEDEEDEDVEEEEEEEEEEEQRLPRARVANQTGAGSLLVGTRGNNYGANGSNTS